MLRSASNLMRLTTSVSQQRVAPLWRYASAVAGQSIAVPSATTSSPSIITPEPPLEPWCGSDVEAIMHKSFEDMIPVELTNLSGRIFNAPIRPDLVHRVVIWQLAKRRSGTAKTKNRSEVKGSGRKIRPQKGTGRSRQGAITSPIFRGGGRAQGPVQRDFNYPLLYNVRRNGLRSVLSSKYACGQLWIVEDAKIQDSKTRRVIEACERYGWHSALIVDDDPDGTSGVDRSLHAASHNVRNALAMNARGLNVYDALYFDMLVLTKPALRHLTDRFAEYDWLI